MVKAAGQEPVSFVVSSSLTFPIKISWRSGVTGSLASLKISCLNAYRFESDLRYSIKTKREQMKKYGFLGPASARKTTLARAVSSKLKTKGIDAEYVSEFATEWIRAFSAITTAWEQYYVTVKQIEREQKLNNKVDCFITDSPVVLGWMYAALLRDKSTDQKDFAIFEDLIAIVTKHSQYDKLFIVPPIEKKEITRARDMDTLNIDFQVKLHSSCQAVCELLQIPYMHLDNADTELAASQVAEIIFNDWRK